MNKIIPTHLTPLEFIRFKEELEEKMKTIKFLNDYHRENFIGCMHHIASEKKIPRTLEDVIEDMRRQSLPREEPKMRIVKTKEGDYYIMSAKNQIISKKLTSEEAQRKMHRLTRLQNKVEKRKKGL